MTGFDVVNPHGDLLVVTAKGYGKRTPLDQYAPKGRYTQGILTIDHNRLDETGPVITGRVVDPDDQISLITSGGIIIRMKVSDVSQMGRATRGVKMVNLDDGDLVSACARIRATEASKVAEEAAGPAASWRWRCQLPQRKAEAQRGCNYGNSRAGDNPTPEQPRTSSIVLVGAPALCYTRCDF
ncbi:MAG: DNA gyrase C-terminal beta-propeller domain-containing protein [Caldilineales bacterium]